MGEVVKQDLENKVVSLRQMNNIELPPTHKATNKFLVVGDNLFSHDYYGDINVFRLSNGEQVSRLALDGSLQGIATDGDFLYLQLRGNFSVAPENVVIARDFYDDEENPMDELSKFVGKPMGFHLKAEEAKERGIVGRIVSLPLDKILSSRSIVYSPSMLADSSHTYLVHKAMDPPVSLSSENGQVRVEYRSDSESGTTFRLKKGEIYLDTETVDSEDGDVLEVDGLPLQFHDGRNRGSQIDASTRIYDDETPDLPSYERIQSASLSVIINGNLPVSREILGMQPTGNLLHVLYEQVTGNRESGIFHVYEPNRLYTLEISVKRLVENS